MVYTLEQNTFIVKSYYRNGEFINGEWKYSIVACKNEFSAKFPEFNVEESALVAHIRDVINRFNQTGSVNKGKPTGRPPVSQNVIDDLQQRVQEDRAENRQTTISRLSLQSGVPESTCQKILKTKLNLHPYKITTVQKLLPADFPCRVNYCNWFQNNLNNDQILDLTFFSDEAWFFLSGYVNSQNFRIWDSENPHAIHEVPLHPQKLGVWLAVSRRRIVGPIFFHNTINARRYREQILQPFLDQLHDDELQLGYFQQDGSRVHTARESINFLREYYDNRIISLGTNIPFPARSPDLTPLDFSLFGYLKDNVFATQMDTLEEMQERITNCCQNINPNMLRNIFENKRRRVQMCLEHNGEHFQMFL